MRPLAKPKTTHSFWTGTTRPAALGLGILLLGLAGPALGGREAPAVWVPLAPGGLENSGVTPPMVLVPFHETLYVPDAGQPPVPWTPEYLAAPGPGSRAGAAPSGLLPGTGRRAGTGAPERQGTAPGRARSFTLSDVLRDVDWRRQTAKRLRQDPGFKPRF